MKRKIMSIFLVGIFLAAGILITPAEKTNMTTQEDINDTEQSITYADNNVYIGETWTIYEPEVFTGSSNAEIVNMSVEWVVEPGSTVAHGTLGWNIFDYNFKEEEHMNPLPLALTTTTVCDYEFTVFDGPTPDDPDLTSGHNSFMGGGLKYADMAHPLDVPTKNEPRRILAFQLNAKTQTYIPALRMTFETETGAISKLGHMIIDFISPSEKTCKDENENENGNTFQTVHNKKIDVQLGDIEIWTGDDPSYIPEIDIDLNKNIPCFEINHSETIDVNASLDYDISLYERVHHPRLLFRWIPCQLLIKLRAFATDTEQHYKQVSSPAEFRILLVSDTYDTEGTIPLPFTVDTSEFPTGVEFVVDYFLSIPIFFGMQLPHERSAESAKTNICWVYN